MPRTASENKSTTRVAPEQEYHVPVQAYYFKCYTPLAVFLGGAEPAMFIQRIHYWLQNAKAGYRLKDGSKWIFNGYKEWQEQMPWLSTWQIGRLVRELEGVGWLISDHFYSLKRSIGFTQSTPSFQEDNQRKWYRIDYVKIYQDTGFDLLFDGVDQSPPTEENAETLENSECAKLHNASCNFAHSSIYKENTKALSRESENEGIEFDKEDTEALKVELNPPNRENNTHPDLDQCSAAPRNKTSKIVITKHDPMFTPESRPARQNPRLKYPDGPWLTAGCLNADFVRDRALLWRTGDTPPSQAFGRMPIEEVVALVCCYYQKPQNQANLEIHWAAYVLKNQRYLSNVKERLDAGISIPQREQQQVLAKLPAVLSAPVPPVYELVTVEESMLPSCLEIPTLTASRVVLPPDDGENYQAYQNNVDLEQVEWMQRFKSVQPVQQPVMPVGVEHKKPKPTTDDW